MGVIACNQCCDWNDYSVGCVKPDWMPCPMVMGKPKQPSNADRIRAMSDEELLNLLSAPCPFFSRVDDKGCPNPKPCRECIADWLKQPAEEET